MAAQIAFNKITIDGVAVDTDQFITGTGVYTIKGVDRTVKTADGMIHHYRLALTKSASFQAYGDLRGVSSVLGGSRTVTLSCDSTQVAQFSGLVTVGYTADPSVSSVTVAGDPEF